MIYFDNGSTSLPKSKEAISQAHDFLINNGASPGRGGHFLAAKAEQILHQCRTELKKLIHGDDQGVISFTLNATHGLNLIIKGSLKSGDHAIITSLEHNSVIRPIQTMAENKTIQWDVLWANSQGAFDEKHFLKLIKPNTKLLVINHVSNVIGSIAPVEKLVNTAKKHGILTLIDVSQSLGIIDIDINKIGGDFLCATGHKGLRAPQGIGFNYIKSPELVSSLIEGGSGQNSISPFHPQFGPEKFEAGTQNIVGIASLLGAITEYKTNQYLNFGIKKMQIMEYMLSEFSKVPEITLYWSQNINKQCPLFSLNIQGALPQNIAYMLERDYKILTRPGLHCAPLAHKTLGTFPNGSLRISIGQENTMEEAEVFVQAIKTIVKRVYDKISQRQNSKNSSEKAS